MKNDTLDIKYSFVDKKLYVQYERSDLDRVRHNPTPYAVGFYHFDRKIGVKKAFDQLKYCIVKSIEDEIAKLKSRLAEYKAVELPQWIIESEKKHKRK